MRTVVFKLFAILISKVKKKSILQESLPSFSLRAEWSRGRLGELKLIGSSARQWDANEEVSAKAAANRSALWA